RARQRQNQYRGSIDRRVEQLPALAIALRPSGPIEGTTVKTISLAGVVTGRSSANLHGTIGNRDGQEAHRATDGATRDFRPASLARAHLLRLAPILAAAGPAARRQTTGALWAEAAASPAGAIAAVAGAARTALGLGGSETGCSGGQQ